MTVVVVGAGWAGCAAALAAVKVGTRVLLFERTDALLGTGQVGGIMRNNGRFTAAEEMTFMGAGELFELTDRLARHRDVEFPGHKHASLYDVTRIEPELRKLLLSAGVEIYLRSRVTGVRMSGRRIQAVAFEGKTEVGGDVFVDATGSSGSQGNCSKYGNGCAMCVLRCPSFGPRVSLAAKAGAEEVVALTEGGQMGAMSGACKLLKESLAPEVRNQLEAKGVVVIPVPPELRKAEGLSIKCCQQYNLPEFEENIVLLDTGHAKLMSPYYPLEMLRQIPGFENALYRDPYAGGLGNSVRFLAVAERDIQLKVVGVENLYCGGEKAGILVGHTEAIVTGTLAGFNAARHAVGQKPRSIPTSTAVGDLIAYSGAQLMFEEGLKKKITFSGSAYFARMKELGFYTTDRDEIAERVTRAGMRSVFK
ncbi:MAG: FAD-dependent oxidoreductase [Actinobacteria bacterium]|nr:FAD-dependent oxidoreductase [Actinomycetota bacterium]